MIKKLYTLILIFATLPIWSQSPNLTTYGNMQSLPSMVVQNFSTDEECSQIIPIPEDLSNGSYLGGNINKRVAVDVLVDQGTMITIDQIKVSLARNTDINYVHFRILDDDNGLPGEELFVVNNTEIISENELIYLNDELGYLRTLTVSIQTPLILHGNEGQRYWMEILTDARAWGATPNSDDVIGKGLAVKDTMFDWYEMLGLDCMYEIRAECSNDNGLPNLPCFQGDGAASNDFEDGFPFNQSDPSIIADDFIVEPQTTFNVSQVKMHVLSTQEEEISDISLIFRTDNGGIPGAIIDTVSSIVPSSQIEIGTAYEIFTVYEVTINLPAQMQFTEGHYWLQPWANATSSHWEITSTGTTGDYSHRSYDEGATWQSTGYQTVFYIAGECEDEDEPETFCDQEFTGSDDSNVATTEGFMRAANDFNVAPGVTFNLENITARVRSLSETDAPSLYSVYIYADNAGTIGDLLESYINLLPEITNAGNYGNTSIPAYSASFDLPTPLTLEGGDSGTKYWVAINGLTEENNGTFWISYIYDANINTSRPTYFSPDSGETWDIYYNPVNNLLYDGVFSVNGSCGDNGESACDFDFTGDVYSGVGFIDDGNENQFRASNDIKLTAGTQFDIQKITLDVVTFGGEPTTFDMYLYADNNGPDEELTSYPVLIPTSIQQNGEFGASGLVVYTVVLELPTTYTLTSDSNNDTTYWIGITADISELSQPVFWVSSQYTENASSKATYQSSDGGSTWNLFINEDASNSEGIMKIEGACDLLSVPDEAPLVSLNYYPNPVKNTLTITAEKSIRSVSIYNLLGQNIKNQSVNKNSARIDLQSLASGVYVVKTILENGQIQETFKIIKE